VIPEMIDPSGSWEQLRVCNFAAKWKLSLPLAQKLVTMSRQFATGLTIISGHRTNDEQDALRAAGRPAAANDKSTHLACPSQGADLRVNGVTTLRDPTSSADEVKMAFGVAAVFAGLRWGGGSPINAFGIPSDWNHVDLGPRV